MKYLCLLVLFVSCAGYQLMVVKPDVSVVDTGLAKKIAYNNALTYLAKSLGNSNYAIRLKDPDSGKIVTKISTSCSGIKNSALDLASYTLAFDLEIDFKDKKMRMTVTPESYTSTNIDGSIIVANSPLKQYQKKGVKDCIEDLKNKVVNAVKEKPAFNW